MAKKSIFREDKKDGAERVLPDPKDVLGLPILADMQFGKWKGGEDVIRVFYRYRGKDVPELIVKEREKLRAKAIEAGRIPAEYPEVRLYLGIVEDLVFHPKSDSLLIPRSIRNLTRPIAVAAKPRSSPKSPDFAAGSSPV